MSQGITVTDHSAQWGVERSRTATWHDPGPAVQEGRAMAGIDYLRALIDRRFPPPPIASVLQFDLIAAEAGRVTFTCEPDESTYNPVGAVHGGLVCTLLDSAAGCALHSVLPAGRWYTSVEIKVNYLRAVRLDTGTLTATGTVVRAGSRVGFTEATVTDGSGTPIATASSTLLIFDV